jgi:hypothetical protein
MQTLVEQLVERSSTLQVLFIYANNGSIVLAKLP